MEYILTDKTHELLNVENILLNKVTSDDLESIIDLYKDKRVAYQEMMKDVRNKNINVIVAFKLDRI